MPRLQTPVDFIDPGFQINYSDNIFLLGSCFSNNIGFKLNDLKFNTIINPFGVLYNPASISNAVQLLIHKKEFEPKDLDFHNGIWFSYNHYTSFSDPDKNKCLEKINEAFRQAKSSLKRTSILFFTLGTSYIYRHIKSNQTVANCHKIPAREFKHELLTIAQSYKLLAKSIDSLYKLNPNIKIVFTVSPIRHLKNGSVNNMRSKAALILAIQQLVDSFPGISYFPVYELFMDEMRDYRFYGHDLVHPNEFAIEYTWEKFSSFYFDQETHKTMIEIEKLKRSLQHRPINPGTPEHEKFLSMLELKINMIDKKLPNIDFSNELSQVSEWKKKYF